MTLRDELKLMYPYYRERGYTRRDAVRSALVWWRTAKP